MMKISFFSRIMKFVANACKKSKGITLGEFTRSYADERRKEGEKIYEGRCGSVLGMLKHLETFGGSDIPLKKVDVETVKQFIDYLRSAHDLHKNMKAPGKLSDSTIHLKVNILKSVLRKGRASGSMAGGLLYLRQAYHLPFGAPHLRHPIIDARHGSLYHHEVSGASEHQHHAAICAYHEPDAIQRHPSAELSAQGFSSLLGS